MTLGDIIDSALNRLTEFNTVSPDLWTRAEITDYVNEGQLDFVRQTECLWELYYNMKVVANQTDYALPADCMILKRVLFDNKTEINPSTWEELDIDDNIWENDSAVDTPDYFYLYDFTTLKLTPKPSTTGATPIVMTSSATNANYGKMITSTIGGVKQTFSSSASNPNYGKVVHIEDSTTGFHYITDNLGKIIKAEDSTGNITLFYIKYPDTLSDNADIPELASPWHRALIYYSLWRCLKKEGEGQELTRANKYIGRYVYLVNLVKKHNTMKITRGQHRIRARRR